MKKEKQKCYFCGKPATRTIRIIESPKDIGIKVPVCEECLEKFENIK